jgi:hypothetical protein
MFRKRYGFMGVGKLTSSRLRKYFFIFVWRDCTDEFKNMHDMYIPCEASSWTLLHQNRKLSSRISLQNRLFCLCGLPAVNKGNLHFEVQTSDFGIVISGFSLVSSTNKSDCCNETEILLKVALNTITHFRHVFRDTSYTRINYTCF